MRIISFFIAEITPIEKIQKCLDLWDDGYEERNLQLFKTSRDPPIPVEEIVYTPIDDGWHHEMDEFVS